MAFRKICQNASLNPYKNPVFPPFRLTGRKYGILMKEYFDIKKAFDTSLGQTDTKPKPLSLWQETNGQQKALSSGKEISHGKKKQIEKTKLKNEAFLPVTARFYAI